MTKSHRLPVIAGGVLVAGLAISILAQGQTRPMAPQPRPFGVALLDVSYIFNKHVGFQTSLADLKAQAANTRTLVEQEKDAIRKLLEGLPDLRRNKPGSREYKQLEEEIATRRSELQISLELQNKEFLDKESSLYYAVHQEIQRAVYDYSLQNNVSLVLRFNGEPVDKTQPEDVLRGVNSSVVWYSQSLDITKTILDRLNARYGGGVQQTASPGQRSRQGVPRPR